MDIMQPPLNQQAAPAPWRLLRAQLDIEPWLHALLRQDPAASADDLVFRLAATGTPVNGTLVAAWLAKQPQATGISAVPATTRPPAYQSRRPKGKSTMKYAHEDGSHQTDAIAQALNRIFVDANYSYARYVCGAAPWRRPVDAELWNAVQETAADHERLATDAARLVLQRRAVLAHGQYPNTFTSSNYLALAHLGPALVEHQRALIDRLKACKPLVENDAEAAALVEDAVSSQQRRLNELEAALQTTTITEPTATLVPAASESPEVPATSAQTAA